MDGEYCFDPAKLQENHHRNYEAFCHSLSCSVPVVICDNTNTKRCYFERYVEAAVEAGYEVEIIVMTHPDPAVAARRNTHKVPEPIIRRMIVELKT